VFEPVLWLLLVRVLSFVGMLLVCAMLAAVGFVGLVLWWGWLSCLYDLCMCMNILVLFMVVVVFIVCLVGLCDVMWIVMV